MNIFNSVFYFSDDYLCFWNIPTEWITSDNPNRPSWLVFPWGEPKTLIAWQSDLSKLPRRYDCFQSCELQNELFSMFFSACRCDRYRTWSWSIFVLFKTRTLKLVSDYLLGRHTRRCSPPTSSTVELKISWSNLNLKAWLGRSERPRLQRDK